MKKIKLTNNIYHQYKKINEDESINTSTNTEDDFDAINISLPPIILDKLKNSIKTDAVKEDTFIRIKMTHDFFDTIYFPQATPNLKRLMEFVDFPGYLKDLGDRLDSDPKVNASKAIDYAAAAFMKTEFSLDPSTNIRRNNSANESYNYIYEAIPSMGDVGAAAGELGVEIGQGIANGISGFTSVVGPALTNAAVSAAPTVGLGIAGLWGGGYALGTFISNTSGDQNPNNTTNDNQYFEDYSNIPEEVFTKSTDPVIAIEEYLKNIQRSIITLLSYITAKSARQDITDLETTIDTLIAKADKTIEAFIQDNNEIFKKQQELDQRVREQRFQNEANISKTKNDILIKILLNNQYTDIKSNPYYTKYQKAKNDLLKLQDLNQELETSNTSESLSILNNKPLLEDDRNIQDTTTDRPYIIFNADNIYNDIKSTISGKITKILSTDPEDWESIKWARKEMDLMQEGADKEILAKIDIICRTTNQENMGLSAKLGAFIRKHPMRAEYLKGLWGRYMKDLDVRKQKRIDNITTPDNGSPMAMCISFLKTTVPSIIAMMLTYKAIIRLLIDQRVRAKSVDIVEDTRITEENIQKKTSDIIKMMEQQFQKFGHYLVKATDNKEITPVYDANNHKFVNTDNINHLGLFMSLFVPKTIFTKNNIGKFAIDINDMLNSMDNAQTFFEKFTEFIDYFGKIEILKDLELSEFFAKLHNQTDIIDILDKMSNIQENISTQNFTNESINNIQHILAYIIATKGQFLKDYEASKEAILGLNIGNPDKAKIKKLREGLHISTDLPSISAEIDDIKETLPVDGIRELFLTTKDMFSVVCTLYYLFGLYKCTNYDKDIKPIEVNYNIVYSLYELIAKNINQVSLLFNDFTTKYELIHFREEYMGINGAIDARGLYDVLHRFTEAKTYENTDINYQEYAGIVDKQLKSKNPLIPQTCDIFVENNINGFNDIISIIHDTSYKTVDDLIKKGFTERNLNTIDNEELIKFSYVFKEYLKQIIEKFDTDFKAQDLNPFIDFVGGVDDNQVITKEAIFVGYDNNNQQVYKTLSEFLSIYAQIIKASLNNNSIKSNLEKCANEVDEKIKNAFKQKTNMSLTFNFANIYDGLFIKMYEQDCTPGNIKNIIDTVSVKSNGHTYKANTEMLVKNSLLNFIPDIFNLPIMADFVNIMYGNGNGKIYKKQKS